LLLLVGAGLFARTLRNLKALDVGIATDHLVTFTIDSRLAEYQPNQTAELRDQILGKLPGLTGCAFRRSDKRIRTGRYQPEHQYTVAGYHPA